MQLAPILLFVYNRPWHTEQTLNALAASPLAGQSVLYIYADGAKATASSDTLKNIQDTRSVSKKQKAFKEVHIIESPVNKGLANSIIAGVTDIVNQYGKVIVMEDDLITHPSFLNYMNGYLEIYENNDSVISIHGYMYPVKKKLTSPFFLKGADCWGWATWKRGWDLFEPDSKLLLDKLLKQNLTREFDFNNSYSYTQMLRAQIEGKVDSWAIRWYASAFLANKLTLYPAESLVQNIGFDGSGTHKVVSGETTNAFNFTSVEINEIDAVEDKKSKKQIELYFKGDNYYYRRLKETAKKNLRQLLRKGADD